MAILFCLLTLFVISLEIPEGDGRSEEGCGSETEQCHDRPVKFTQYVDLVEASSSLVSHVNYSEEIEIEIVLENECNTDEEDYNYFDWVEVRLTSEKSFFDVNSSTQRIEMLYPGNTSVFFTILGIDDGNDTMVFEVMAHNPHFDRYMNDSYEHALTVVPPPPDMFFSSLSSPSPPTPPPASLLEFNPWDPTEGTMVTLVTKVNNTGAPTTFDIDYYYDVIDKDHLIATDRMTLQMLGSQISEVNWNTTGFEGDFTVYAVIDPKNLTDETNELNNTILAPIFIRPRPTSDIMLTKYDIEFSDSEPMESEIIFINATIYNVGVLDSKADVLVYLDQRDDDHLLSRSTELTINPTVPVTITLPWNTTGFPGQHTIIVNISNVNNTETDLTNNEAENTVIVRTKPDITVSNIELSKAEISDYERVTITAIIHNTGETDADAAVVFYLDERSTVPIRWENISLTGEKNASVTLEWTALKGIHSIIVDVLAVSPADDDLSNNHGEIVIDVLGRVDLTIVTDFTFFPSEPIEGDIVIISTSISNNGSEQTNATVNFYHGDTSAESYFGNTTVTILPNSTKKVSIIWTSIGGYSRIYAAVIRSYPLESNITNNVGSSFLNVHKIVDLQFNSTISLSEMHPYDGERITIGIDVINLGVRSGNGYVLFFENEIKGGTLLLNRTIACEPGGSVSISFDRTVELGLHLITVYVVENGNISTEDRSFEVIPKMDLYLVNTGLLPTNPNNGDVVEIVALVKNTGKRAAFAQVNFYQGSTLLFSSNITIGPESLNFTTFYWNSQIGDHELRIRLTSRIIEMDNQNNELIRPVNVQPQEDIAERSQETRNTVLLLIPMFFILILMIALWPKKVERPVKSSAIDPGEDPEKGLMKGRVESPVKDPVGDPEKGLMKGPEKTTEEVQKQISTHQSHPKKLMDPITVACSECNKPLLVSKIRLDKRCDRCGKEVVLRGLLICVILSLLFLAFVPAISGEQGECESCHEEMDPPLYVFVEAPEQIELYRPFIYTILVSNTWTHQLRDLRAEIEMNDATGLILLEDAVQSIPRLSEHESFRFSWSMSSRFESSNQISVKVEASAYYDHQKPNIADNEKYTYASSSDIMVKDEKVKLSSSYLVGKPGRNNTFEIIIVNVDENISDLRFTTPPDIAVSIWSKEEDWNDGFLVLETLEWRSVFISLFSEGEESGRITMSWKKNGTVNFTAIQFSIAPVPFETSHSNALGIAGRITGIVALALVVVSLIFGGMSRSLTKRLNKSITAGRRVRFHCILSFGLLAVSIYHGVILLVGPFEHMFWDVWNLIGDMAGVFMGLLGYSGMYEKRLVRRFGFTTWKRAHQLVALVAVVLAVLHSVYIGTDFRFIREFLDGFLDGFPG